MSASQMSLAHHLVVPPPLARLDVEGEDGRGVQVVSFAEFAAEHRDRVAGREVDRPQLGIDGADQPDAAAAEFPGVVVLRPGVVAGGRPDAAPRRRSTPPRRSRRRAPAPAPVRRRRRWPGRRTPCRARTSARWSPLRPASAPGFRPGSPRRAHRCPGAARSPPRCACRRTRGRRPARPPATRAPGPPRRPAASATAHRPSARRTRRRSRRPADR